MTQDRAAIAARGLTKHYGEVQALAGVDFAVREGELLSFLALSHAARTRTNNVVTGLA